MRKTPKSQALRRTSTRLLPALLAFLFCTGFGTWERLFAPNAVPWPRWERHDPASNAKIDHATWSGFLSRYVIDGPDGSTRVAYGKVSKEDREALDAYLANLASARIDAYARDEQLAYWINLYNALTVRVVLDHYPVKSIRDINISPGLLQAGPWDKKLVTVEGEEISLGDIEHRILRPLWKDPRIHYALNCASIGCPNLDREAFTAGTIDDQLTDAAIVFINSPRGVRIRDGRITASSIYDWFHADFGGDDAAVFDHILRYTKPESRSTIRAIGKIDNVAYDWRLNDAD
jgi:hypothetical protein